MKRYAQQKISPNNFAMKFFNDIVTYYQNTVQIKYRNDNIEM